jgi:hypothetical protein
VLTFFTTAKPFRGHSGRIQRNALASWTLVHPEAEVILFGDDDGAAEAAREIGLRHEPYVERNEYGTKRLDYMFTTARAIARHDVLCYVNCDIILMEDFRRALERVKAEHSQFLMVGRRWDLEMAEPCDFTQANWRSQLQALALMRGVQRTPEWIDYFAFSHGLYGSSVPPFVVGRIYWDDWLVWKALDLNYPVVDASEVVIAVHQNHDYAYHPQGKQGMWRDAESQRNLELAGGYEHLRTIESAQFRLGCGRISRNPWHRLAYARWTARRLAETYSMRARTAVQNHFWHPLLDFTRPLRRQVGIRQETVASLSHRRERRIG